MISIITAAYHSEATLADTIDSVLAQRYPHWEMIIVDGSQSEAIAALVSTKADSARGRIRLIQEPDSGPYDAMNKGIAAARGEIVGFLNSDDRFASPDILSLIADAFADTSTEAVCGDVVYMKDGRVKRKYSSAHFCRRKMLRGLMPAHPTFYVRREIYERFGTFDTRYRIAADFELAIRIIYKGRVVPRFIPATFVEMRTGGLSTAGWRSHRTIIADHFSAYRRHRLWAGFLLDFTRYPGKLFSKR